ncbi:hypothetical protein K2173_009152 [Erythroxylum novogranatense]|uniref:BHLH domain-containing protein n=1 Tax=Erythroxylum novogranatense TaxID=1862640 RepID=A0AAV8TD47_9ROSI|nr:hypothetical protein K2173_009152 [Erythroxylum novogranatense]
MVCQAASQTRFRALKYENGIAGKQTIIVRVIACYQPLQDCQEYLAPNFSDMSSSLEPVQQGCLSACVKAGTFTTSGNVAMSGFTIPSVPCLKTQPRNEVNVLPCHLPPRVQNLAPATNFSIKTYHPMVAVMPSSIPAYYSGCLIFDQSENQRRVMHRPLCSGGPKPSITAMKMESDYDDLKAEGYAAKLDQLNPEKLMAKETDGNHFGGEESEMPEDTEEINALLYSDDDDGYGNYSYSDDDDEVTSTGHSPIVTEPCNGMQEQEEITEEVASSVFPIKRQKLLDGEYKRSSLGDSRSSIKSGGAFGYADLSYIIEQIQEEESVSNLVNKQSRKEKIRATLEILKTVVPSAKRKSPLLVLDEAIDYLKSLKLRVKNVGVNRC